ncbi:MAG: DnaJ domain-containing protein [Deltaproteobacteria bacterium]|nr:DnaJ domain-containing protein [Deltaproteobacteria bacterium]
MATGPLSIKLRCASWQQLATIYKRDLSRGTMFLKAGTPPPIGTQVRIDLTLPSASVIVLTGVVEQHLTDPQRGDGVELKLAPIPASSVWMIESALASEVKRRDTPPAGVPIVIAPASSGPIPAFGDSDEVIAAEQDLIKALVSEAESLRKLNPFLVLGVGYEASDTDVRAAFGELTKRYHPDLFARYESAELRQLAAEIFILIRDAYRKLGDDAGRVQALATLGRPAPRPVPVRAPPPPPVAVKAPPLPSVARPRQPETPRAISDATPTVVPGEAPPAPTAAVPRARQPETPRAISDGTPTLRPGEIPPMPTAAVPPARVATAPVVSSQTPSKGVERIVADQRGPTELAPRKTPSGGIPPISVPVRPTTIPPPKQTSSDGESSPMDDLMNEGKFDEAIHAYKIAAKKNPSDRSARAGVEVAEGLRAMAQRDRLEAAQRFEAALEIDPSNERAARELADMRRQATNERKGLLTRLMGKKE